MQRLHRSAAPGATTTRSIRVPAHPEADRRERSRRTRSRSLRTSASGLGRIPAALPLPDYDRARPTPAAVRAAITGVVRDVDWARLGWSALVEELVRVGRTDVPLSRLTEGHVDALRILDQAGRASSRPGSIYGVWASRSQATGVRAVRTGSSIRLNGLIKFASGAGIIDRALVPVWLDDSTHLLIDLDVSELPVDRTEWRAAGMRQSQSHSVSVIDVEADADAVVGRENFYLSRPEFLPGGVGVAGVWAGGAARLADLTSHRVRHGPPDAVKDVRLGQLRTDLVSALSVVREAGRTLDDGLDDHDRDDLTPDTATVSALARAAVAAAVNRMLSTARSLAGAAGVAFDGELTEALDDLGLYVLQHNDDKAAAGLGAELRLRSGLQD